jgi:hypothetical protein
MSTCELILRDEWLERGCDGFLSPAEEVELRGHLASCRACAARAAAVTEETRVLRGAGGRALARAWPRRSRVAAWGLAAAVLLAVVLVFAGFSSDRMPPPPSNMAPLVLELGPTVAMGVFEPPCFAQCCLRAEWVVVVEVEALRRDAEKRLRRIDAKRREVLWGKAGEIPSEIRLATRPGISELGLHRFPVKKGTKLVLLLARVDGGIRLFTGDTHSTAGVGIMVYLPSAYVRFKTFAQIRGMIAGALALRRVVETAPFKDAAAPLARALRGKDGLLREVAIDAYSIRCRGRSSDHCEFSETDAKPIHPPLPAVDAALADLISFRREEIGTIVGKSFALLAGNGYADFDVWATKLAIGDVGDDVYEHLRTLDRTANPEVKARLRTALRNATGRGNPIVRYLSAGLLHELGDSSRLGVVLKTEITGGDLEIVKRLSVGKTGPVWPRLRYLSGLAGKKLETRDRAEVWIASLKSGR